MSIEYKNTHIDQSALAEGNESESMEKKLNEHGKEGWKLCHLTDTGDYYWLLFYREVNNV